MLGEDMPKPRIWNRESDVFTLFHYNLKGATTRFSLSRRSHQSFVI